MSILLMAGAETGHRTSEGLTANGNAAVSDTAIKRGSHAHSASWKFTSQTAVMNLRNTVSFAGVVGRWYWLRAYIYSPSGTAGLPNTTKRIMLFSNGTAPGTGLGWAVALKADRTLVLLDGAGAEQGTPVALTADTFTLVEFGLQVNGSGGTDFAELWINGVQAHSVSGSVTDLTVNHAQFGWINAPNNAAADKTMYLDDILVTDDQGSDFNTRRGEGSIGYLAPVADFARVGWTDGNSGTSNLFGSLDNIPPTGEAVSGTTASSQIEDAQNNNTDDFTAEVEDYDTAAIPSNRRIRAVRAIATVGSSSLTGSNDGNLRLTSNPADATADATSVFNFDVSGAVAAAFPTGWQGVAGAVVYDPNPTRSTRPRWRIGRREAANRTMAACAGGVQVEYGDIRVPVAQATETDTAGQLTARKTKAIGQATETDTAGQVSAAKVVPVSQATGTDTAGAVTARKTKTIAEVEETDTAGALTARKTKEVAEAEEADTAGQVSATKIVPVNPAEETDTAGQLTPRKTGTVGQAVETDTAQPITPTAGDGQTIILGQAVETDTAQPIAPTNTLVVDVLVCDEPMVMPPALIAGQFLNPDTIAAGTTTVFAPSLLQAPPPLEVDTGPTLPATIVFSPSLIQAPPSLEVAAGPTLSPVVFAPALLTLGQPLNVAVGPVLTSLVFAPTLIQAPPPLLPELLTIGTTTVFSPRLEAGQAIEVDAGPSLVITMFSPALFGTQFIYVDVGPTLSDATVFPPALRQPRPPVLGVAGASSALRTAR